MTRVLGLGALCALVAACAAGATSQTQEQAERTQFRPRAFASGFSQPLYLTGAKGEPGRLYVVEQGGVIQVLQNGKRRSAPFCSRAWKGPRKRSPAATGPSRAARTTGGRRSGRETYS